MLPFSLTSLTNPQTWSNHPETSATASTSPQSCKAKSRAVSEGSKHFENMLDMLKSKHRRLFYLSLLSMDMAQMFLQRLSRPLVACWMESHSVSVEQASQSCSRTSHRFNTDATPVLCFSMSRCRSYKKKKVIAVWCNFFFVLCCTFIF